MKGKFNRDFVLVKESNIGTFSDYKDHTESSDYLGCEYSRAGVRYIQRTAKVTPKKVGQFVTLWKRDSAGETVPMEVVDSFDFVVIVCFNDCRSGKFLFPKDVLLQKQIVSSLGKGSLGKRGFRVYPPWDKPTSKQALITQAWQLNYFSDGLVF